MTKKLILDTNAILRFILNDVPPQYKEVVDLIIKAKSKKILLFIPEIVVFEIAFTLKSYYEYSKETVLNVLESLLSAEYMEVENKQTLLNALKVYRETNLQLVDCYLIAKSEIENTSLFTFDKNLRKYLLK